MHCAICGNAVGNTTHVVPDTMLGTDETFPYLECARCGCLQLARVPADMSQYYPPEYYSFAGYRLKSIDLNWRVLRYLGPLRRVVGPRRIHDLLPSFMSTTNRSLAPIDLRADSAILDVGCGSGYLPHRLYRAGFHRCVGIEPFIAEDKTSDDGFRLLKRNVLDMPAEGSLWNLITFHHSFEHELQGEETLRHVHRLLAPGGTCLIRIPSVSSFGWRFYGTCFAHIDAPRHFYVHSVESMTLLAQKTGLEVQMVIDDTTEFEFVSSEQARRGIARMSDRSYYVDRCQSIFTRRDIRRFREYAARLNRVGLGGTKAFYLRKVVE